MIQANNLFDLVIHETDKSYSAGIIDADGCITIAIMKHPQRTYGVQHVLQVHVKMSNVKAIKFLKEKFGGKIYPEKPSGIGTKPMHHWVLNGNDALFCLFLIGPYLKVKKPQAKIGIAFQRGFPQQIHPISKVEFQRRKKLYERMKGLNHSES